MAKKVFKEDIIEICITPTLEFVEVLVPSVIAIVSMDGTHPLIQSEKLYMEPRPRQILVLVLYKFQLYLP